MPLSNVVAFALEARKLANTPNSKLDFKRFYIYKDTGKVVKDDDKVGDRKIRPIGAPTVA